MEQSLRDQFLALCENAYRKDLAVDDCALVEPYMVNLIHLVNLYPDNRTLFVDLFLAIDDGRINAPEYLMPFCMRLLRFPEIREKILHEPRNTPQFRRRMNYMSYVMHAYDDHVWQDADMWSYYQFELNRTTP